MNEPIPSQPGRCPHGYSYGNLLDGTDTCEPCVDDEMMVAMAAYRAAHIRLSKAQIELQAAERQFLGADATLRKLEANLYE